MRWQIKLKKRAEKGLKKIPIRDQQRILIALASLEENPFTGKKLDGKLLGVCSCRVWPYRILYRIFNNLLLVVVIDIDHRQGVYH